MKEQSMIDPTIPMLLAARPDQVPHGMLIPMIVTAGECAGCACTLLLSPSSAKLIAKGRVQPVCADCAERFHKDRAVVVMLTDDGRADLRQFAKDEAERN
jgi:hypothetical protein